MMQGDARKIDLRHDTVDVLRKIRVNIAEELAAIKTKSQKRHDTLVSESKALKTRQWKTHADMKNVFSETLVPRVKD